MKKLDWNKLFRAASQARKFAHAPYSKYKVGAALAFSGKIVTGCNVENSNYGGTICSERTAMVKAVSEGLTKPQAIVVMTPTGGAPCGNCLQVLSEFCSPSMPVALATPKKIVKIFSLSQLLPHAFRAKDLR